VYWLGKHVLSHTSLERKLRPESFHSEILTQPAKASSPSDIAGLVAAAFYAFSVLPIQLSHYATVDAVLTFCVTAAVALAARWALRGGKWAWVLAGIMCGLAVGSKFSAVLLAVPLAAAALYRVPDGTPRAQALVVARRLAVALAAAGITFALTNPFALIELAAYANQIGGQNAMVSGAMDAPYTRQYIGTVPYVYFIAQLSQWGLGWPLGILAWGGLVWATVEFGRHRAGPVLTVTLAWVLPYFATTGLFHAKFLRYMAPIVPCLIALGAAWVVGTMADGRWKKEDSRASEGRHAIYSLLSAIFYRPIVRYVLVALAVVATAGWALAFVQVYQQEHPWIAASRWIYREVPAGAKLLTEHWDDALPLALDELPDRPPPREYVRVELPLWDEDTAAKAGRLAAELASGDYIILASNRLSAPIQRLAGRYPMGRAYYRLLFAGELGYTRVAEFTAYPRLGPLVIPDDHADESFTVYDHPHVVVFANTGRLPAGTLAERLGRYLPDAAVSPSSHRAPGLARYTYQPPAPDAPLTLDQPVDTLPVVSDFRWNRAASESGLLAVVVWWFVASLLGWITWPLLFPRLRGLADRGYGLARAFGWLLLGWVHWLGASVGLWQNRLEVLLALLLVLALAGRVAWAAQRARMVAFQRSHGQLLLAEEGVYALAFLAFIGVRLLNPDLWQPWNGGEKFMEFAFLNAILRSPTFPPLDPYYAGGIINYYYFGLYLVGLLIKLTGIVPEVAFNLAIPSIFALTALGVFSVATSLTRYRKQRYVGSLVAVVVTLLLGNLQGLAWLLDAAGQLLRGGTLPFYDYWSASRVIPYTINEFPLWSFTFADLHPHLIAMPFGVLVLGLALNWLSSHLRLSLEQAFLNVVVLGIALGALGAINTWDLPTYALLVLGALMLRGWRSGRGSVAGGLARGFVAAAVIVLLAVAAYWPFYASYVPQIGDGHGPLLARFLGWVRDASPLESWLQVWGGWLFIAISYVLAEWVRGRRRAGSKRGSSRGLLVGLLALFAVVAVLAAVGRPTAALAALPLCLALLLVVRRDRSAEDAFTALLLVMGLAVIGGVELLYLRDFLAGSEWYRMNTLFKFYMPAWLFMGVAAARMLPATWDAARRSPVWLRVPWGAAASVLLAGSFVFLVIGVRNRVDDRFPGARPPLGTLDATAYMTVGEYTWPDQDSVIALRHEREAIQWLLRNVSGTPVIAEAPAGSYTVDGESVAYDYYRAGGLRVASLTGFPTFVGQHQYEQRPGDQVAERTTQAQRLFQTTDIAEARRLLSELRVGYVYVGRLERILFSADALRKFDVLVDGSDLAVIYRNPDVTIYRVVW
jgi:YYY domain-containing protein